MPTARPARPACGHDTPAVAPAVCIHLRDQRQPLLSYYRCFHGSGLDHALLCRACADEFSAGSPPATFSLCPQCLEFATTEVGDLVGVRGQPEVVEAPVGRQPAVRAIGLPPLPSAIIDLAHADSVAQWYGLCADGTIVALAAGLAAAEPVARLPLRAEPDLQPFDGHPLRPRLHVAPSGRFAAVVNDYGRFGAVIDLTSDTVTLALDGGGNHPETVPFALTFAAVDHREVVVHRTGWNRLDVSDPASGQLLTERTPTGARPGGPGSDHDLDYFHGRLHLSPDGQRLLDDGWVWHPVGIPEVWDLDRWLSENVWESEDGPSKVPLDGRHYYWDHGMCWIDERRVAVEGIGTDDDHMVAGARIFDVEARSSSPTITWPTARELSAFAGPTGTFFSNGVELYSSDEDGLSIWDVEAGTRTGRIPGFSPRHQARAAGELVDLRDDRVLIWP